VQQVGPWQNRYYHAKIAEIVEWCNGTAAQRHNGTEAQWISGTAGRLERKKESDNIFFFPLRPCAIVPLHLFLTFDRFLNRNEVII